MLVTQIETSRYVESGTTNARSSRVGRVSLVPHSVGVLQLAILLIALSRGSLAQPPSLNAADFEHYVTRFNSHDNAPDQSLIPNDVAWNWITSNVPLFACPDKELEETYYFRWWTFRKHIKHTPQGFVLTEFLAPVRHAGPYNTISCAFGHHLAEGAWVRDRRQLDDYTKFWFRSGPDGGPAPHFHKFSSWAAAAIYNRYLVNGDRSFVVNLLDDLVRDYEHWETERLGPDGLYWQFDVADGMEESISGSRTKRNCRPTINSYMVANAQAIASIAHLAGRTAVATQFESNAHTLRIKLVERLWDSDAKFFKVRLEDGSLSDAREAIGFVPWMFNLADPANSIAWKQSIDPEGFSAPHGLTTAERRHLSFRTHGTGTCEWDGAVWPFATSQTLNGMINLLRGPNQPYVTRHDFWNAMQTYSRSHQKDGYPYIGEYFDERTGGWLITGKKEARSRDYNHSTFCDLVIRGIVGIVPRKDDVVEIDPLIPPGTWDWFCLDRVLYHDRTLTVVWDRTGKRFSRGAGLAVWADGKEVARAAGFSRVTGRLPPITSAR